MNRKQVRNTLLLVLGALIWGCAFVAQSVGAEYVGAFTFLATRSWLGSVVLLPVIAVLDARAKAKGEPPRAPQTPQDKRTLLQGGLACGCFLFLASLTQQMGIAATTTAKASFITALYVVLVPVFTLFMGRKVGKKIWLCVALGVVGLYLLCMVDGLSLSPGDALVLLCAFLFVGHILTIDHFSPMVDGVRLSFLQFLVTAVVSTVCMFVFERPTWQAIADAALPILYAGIMSSGVAYTLQIIGQKDLNPTIASLAMCLESVFGALAGWVVLGQALSPREFSGCLLMFTAIILAQLPDRKKAEITNS